MNGGRPFSTRIFSRTLLPLLMVLVSLNTPNSSAFTHWIVADDGRIRHQMSSVFHMKRPHDLVEFMRQERRVDYLQNLKYDMTEQKLDAVEKRHDVTLEAKLFAEDEDCIKAKMALSEYDLYVSTMILPEDDSGIFSGYNFDGAPPFKEPECYDPKDTFHLELLDGLEGVADQGIAGLGELGLKSELLHGRSFSFEEYGHLIQEALHSPRFEDVRWKVYLYASAYWRVIGRPSKAIECLRRSYRRAPEEDRYMPLTSMGSVLHRARYSEDAVVVLTLALGLGGLDSNVFYTLGNAHAVLLELDQSALSYARANILLPNMADALERMHAVLCHQKIETALERQQEELKETLRELRQYKKQHEDWTQVLNKIMDEQAPLDARLRSRMDYEARKSMMTKGRSGRDCFQITSNGHRYITCSLDRRNGIHSDILRAVELNDIQPAVNLESDDIDDLVKKLETRAEAIALTPTSDVPKKVKDFEPAPDLPLPTAEECDGLDADVEQATRMKHPLPWSEAPFVAPEEWGFDVGRLVSESIGLDRDRPSPLPWIPPTCAPFEANLKYKKLKLLDRSKIKGSEEEVERKYSSYSPERNVQEMGARVTKAIGKEVEPKWILYMMAGTHWRVFGSAPKAVNCLKHALYHVPSKFKDVVLTNLAATLFRAGALDEALTVIEDAVRAKSGGVEAEHLMGNIFMMKGNYSGAMEHYWRVLKIDPDFKNAKELWKRAYCSNEYREDDLDSCAVEDGVDGCAEMGGGAGTFMKSKKTGDKKKGKKSKLVDLIQQRLDETRDPSVMMLNVPSESVSELVFISTLSERDEVTVHVVGGIPNHPQEANNAYVVGAVGQASAGKSPETGASVRSEVLEDALSDLYREPHPEPPIKNVTPDFCRGIPRVDWSAFTSTLLAVGAKGVILLPAKDDVDDATLTLRMPHCQQVPTAMHLPDHLEGVKRRRSVVAVKETGLLRLFLSLADNFSGDASTNVMSVASRIAGGMAERPESWALSAMASLFWRIEGDADEAIECARHSIYHAPPGARDVGLLSISNVLFGAELYHDALVTGRAAFDISGDRYSFLPFHLGNIYQALGNSSTAVWFYEEAVRMNPTFNEAQRRADVLRCLMDNILIL